MLTIPQLIDEAIQNGWDDVRQFSGLVVGTPPYGWMAPPTKTSPFGVTTWIYADMNQTSPRVAYRKIIALE